MYTPDISVRACSRCCATNTCHTDLRVTNTDCRSSEKDEMREIEMFGLQGSSSSPTDPLFRQLSQDCPIRGLTTQTQRLLLACNLGASKRECGRRENEKTEIQGGSNGARVECRQLRTCPQTNANTLFLCPFLWLRAH